jgi:hypothetical protein
VVIYGDTRTGKSRLAADILRDMFPGQRLYKKERLWWRRLESPDNQLESAHHRADAALDRRAGVSNRD